MQTPFGDLTRLDLSDHDLCRQFLALDKHRLAEGLVIESLFDQYLETFPGDQKDVPRLIDADTAIAVNRGDKVTYAFVWDRGSPVGLGRYLTALGQHYRVILVRFDNAHKLFTAAECREGKRVSTWFPLPELAQKLSGKNEPSAFDIDASVRDTKRINQSFWGYLSEHYGTDLGQRVILPRIFLNFGIQPWFQYVWNVDRIYLQGNQLWHLEIKHKYPMSGRPLTFGLNDGELRMIRQLAHCGLRSLHTIIVKPRWDKETGSMFLTNNMTARSSAAVIGREITSGDALSIMRHAPRYSGADTSFTGRKGLKFYPLLATDFSSFGTLGMPHTEVATRMDAFMRGEKKEPVTDDWLLSLKMK